MKIQSQQLGGEEVELKIKARVTESYKIEEVVSLVRKIEKSTAVTALF